MEEIEIKWHCPHCLYAAEGNQDEVAFEASVHLDEKHEVDLLEIEDDAILAMDDRLTHEIADMYADSLGGLPLDELHRNFAKDVLAKVDEVRGDRE